MLNGHVFGLAVACLQIFVQRGENLMKEAYDSVSDLTQNEKDQPDC